jgi:diguanylate cyclase (GGDEF)-like protein
LGPRARTLGALVLSGRHGAFSAAHQRVLGILANQAASALATSQYVEEKEQQAVRDRLTDLYNRRAFDELLAGAIARADRRGSTVALLMLDLDHFKKLNDTYGHPAGDAVLRHAAGVLRKQLRQGDVAARFGGEEFAVILPDTDEPGALHLADRVREAVQQARLVHSGARLAVTVSVGAAVWPHHAQEPDTLLDAADRALYAAKEAGRNRVRSA